MQLRVQKATLCIDRKCDGSARGEQIRFGRVKGADMLDAAFSLANGDDSELGIFASFDNAKVEGLATSLDMKNGLV